MYSTIPYPAHHNQAGLKRSSQYSGQQVVQPLGTSWNNATNFPDELMFYLQLSPDIVNIVCKNMSRNGRETQILDPKPTYVLDPKVVAVDAKHAYLQ